MTTTSTAHETKSIAFGIDAIKTLDKALRDYMAAPIDRSDLPLVQRIHHRMFSTNDHLWLNLKEVEVCERAVMNMLARMEAPGAKGFEVMNEHQALGLTASKEELTAVLKKLRD